MAICHKLSVRNLNNIARTNFEGVVRRTLLVDYGDGDKMLPGKIKLNEYIELKKASKGQASNADEKFLGLLLDTLSNMKTD